MGARIAAGQAWRMGYPRLHWLHRTCPECRDGRLVAESDIASQRPRRQWRAHWLQWGMDLLDGDVWRAVLSQLDNRSICRLAQASRLGWQATCHASALDVLILVGGGPLERRLASLLDYVTHRKGMQVHPIPPW